MEMPAFDVIQDLYLGNVCLPKTEKIEVLLDKTVL